jgi:hypothetical protein
MFEPKAATDCALAPRKLVGLRKTWGETTADGSEYFSWISLSESYVRVPGMTYIQNPYGFGP